MNRNKEITSFEVSQILQDLFINKQIISGFIENALYYGETESELYYILLDLRNGYVQCLTNDSRLIDYIHVENNTVVKAWIFDELAVYIGSTFGVTYSDFIYNQETQKFEHTIIYNDVSYTGIDDKLVNAQAKAFIEVLNNL